MKNALQNKDLPSLPTPTTTGIERFLAGPEVKGIGKKYAERIVETLGDEILKSTDNLEEKLEKVPGLGGSKIKDLKESLVALKYSPSLYAFLYSTGLSDAGVEKILSHYKKKTEQVIAEDPYQMVEEVWKLSFFTADKIGKFLEIPSDDPRRLRGALVTAVKITAENGNMFATRDEALSIASSITGVDKDKISPEIENVTAEGRLIESKGGLYIPVYYKAESEGAERLASLIKDFKKPLVEFPLPKTDRAGNPLSKDQLAAIKTVIDNPVTVITGGPGTGKTTTVRGIIKLLEDCEQRVILAAPTGRAAKRLSDLTGRDSMTLHRLLGYSPGRGYKNKHFDADIVIIDEASMLEQVMFNHLLQALKPETKIVLVGDVDQLPAIGAGDVLRDLINSGTVPVVPLNENFRQREGSMIARNAGAINRGSLPEIKEESDFIMITEGSAKRIHERLVNLVADELPAKYLVDPKDIQVVSPQQEGPLGAKQLNVDIQQRVNPNAPEIKRGMKIFRLGDRVMQTSNSSARKTYNGETGWISSLDPETQKLEVTFYDGKKSVYDRKELGELSLAYATTVHKLQGSETDYMVMPMTMGHKPMLYRNLLYTGVSRAKKMCVIVGEEKALRTAVDNPAPAVRHSNFKTRLREYLPVKYNPSSQSLFN